MPLYMTPASEKPPEGQKTLNEVTYATIRALSAKQSLPTLTDAINVMVKESAASEPESSGAAGRVTEQKFREVLRETCAKVLDATELEAIFPSPVESRHASKDGKKSSKELKRRASRENMESKEKPTEDAGGGG